MAETACAVIGQGGRQAGFIGAGQAVIKIVDIAPHAIARQVGAGIVAEGAAGGGGVLVEAVGGIAPGAVGVTDPLVAVVSPAVSFDVLGLVAGISPGIVLGGAGQVLREAGQGGLGVVAIAGGGAVAQGDGGPPRQVVVGVAGQGGDAVFQDRGRTVQGIIGLADVERGGFRPGSAGTVAGRVVLVGQGFSAGGRASAVNAIDAPPYVDSILQAHLTALAT